MERTTRRMKLLQHYRIFLMHQMIHQEQIICILSMEQKENLERQLGLITNSYA